MYFHLALRGEWDEAVARGGPYTRSSLGRSLEEEGFIHLSLAEQVDGTFERFYAGRTDVVRLGIDPARLVPEVKVEGGFPHLYGPLDLAAVVEARPFP